MTTISLKNFIADDRSEIANIYWNTEQRCIKIAKLMPCYPAMLMFLGALIYSFYCLHVGNRDTSTWILPYKISLPFVDDIYWNSIHGWYLLWFIQANLALSYSLIMVLISAYFVCCCFYIEALCKHFTHLIHSLNVDMGTLSENDFRIIKETLSEAVSIHNTVFE